MTKIVTGFVISSTKEICFAIVVLNLASEPGSLRWLSRTITTTSRWLWHLLKATTTKERRANTFLIVKANGRQITHEIPVSVAQRKRMEWRNEWMGHSWGLWLPMPAVHVCPLLDSGKEIWNRRPGWILPSRQAGGRLLPSCSFHLFSQSSTNS